ncbi:MAG: hypothetical protein JW934_21775 [Anaerolineae bacterium]|nr:hypothetical protein [Anaerolineae bacterium]
MDTVLTRTSADVADRLLSLARLYREGQASELMDRTLDKLLAQEAQLSQSQLVQLQADLRAFEAQYDLTSDEFYCRFQAGQTDDRMDFVEWASLVQMRDNLQARLNLLTGQAA